MGNVLEILLVEDDLDARANLTDILELDGHHVLLAGSGGEACQVAAVRGPCAIILDRRLPDATAEDLLPSLRRAAPTAEIIVVTGYADLDSTISAFRQGVADYILKPVNPDALRLSLRRIEERRRIQRELTQEQQFADLILTTAEAAILVLSLSGNIIRFNPHFQRLSGWSLDEVVGADWFEQFIPQHDRPRIREIFMNTARDVHTSGVVNAIITKDGQLRHFRWSNTTIKSPEGKTQAVLAVGVDVTDLLVAQQQMLQSERLAAIGQTMTAVAHESRNALQRIHAGLEMLRMELEENSGACHDLDTIERATESLDELLEEVRSYAAPIKLHLETTKLSDVWRRVWRHLSCQRGQRDLEIVEVFNGGEPTLTIDVLRFEQVFRNLFENAMAACRDPARITIRYSCSDQGVEIVVSDNGAGLDRSAREQIFEPFFTTKSGGTGLGLSIVRRIIEAHKGSISLAPCPPRGDTCSATFIIKIPLSCEPMSSAERHYSVH